jgi:hypothetical protein
MVKVKINNLHQATPFAPNQKCKMCQSPLDLWVSPSTNTHGRTGSTCLTYIRSQQVFQCHQILYPPLDFQATNKITLNSNTSCHHFNHFIILQWHLHLILKIVINIVKKRPNTFLQVNLLPQMVFKIKPKASTEVIIHLPA